MFTLFWWWEDEFLSKKEYFGVLLKICVTPFTLVMDLIILPLEIVTFVIWKLINRE